MQRTLDLDWIVPAIDTIRSRIVWQLGEDGNAIGRFCDGRPERPALRPQRQPDPNTGEAVEHRYTLDDFKQFFDGFGLQVRGTIAGVESYPPNPYGRPALRDEFGKATYDTMVAVEDVLMRQNLDLHAKHWAIYAERGAPHALRTPRPIHPRESESGPRVEGAYDVEFVSYDGGRAAAPGTTLLATIKFRNKSWRSWDSRDPGAPVFLSYHWLDADGALAIDDGLRTSLPHAVAPGAACEMTCRIDTPPRAGRYTLAVDLVEEGVTWFSRAGAPLLKVDFRVR